MNLFSPNSNLMRTMNWLSDMLTLQWLWALYCLKGGLFLGFFPATQALYSANRQLLKDQSNSGFKEKFAKEYNAHFFKANVIGYVMAMITVMMALNLRASTVMENKMGFIYFVMSFIMMVFLMLFNITFWAFFAHFDLTIKQLLKHQLIILLLNPFYIILIFGSISVFLWLSERWFILFVLILISMFSYFITWIVQRCIGNVEGMTG